VAAGDRLLEQAVPTGERLVWPGLHVPRGFSHGHCGVAWSLGELAHATGETRFLEASRAAVAQEQSLLADGVWNDIPGNAEGSSWCHGPAGIALGYLRLYQRRPCPQGKRAAEAALEKMSGSADRADHILCHGALGNLEPLLMAREIFPETPRWDEAIRRKVPAVLDQMQRHGWVSQLPASVIDPGLMMGVAGIGYGMLRLAGAAPCVLLLDPPGTV
jgi:lantibiotic modifying enzyme